MPRPKLHAGGLGKVQLLDLPSGRVQARALYCDELGAVHRVKASGANREAATAALTVRVEAIRDTTGGAVLAPDATIEQACTVFLFDKEHSGTVEPTTVDAYTQSVRNVIVPVCGGLMLRDFTVRRCNRILTDIREDYSLSAARKARSVLSQVCRTGIEHEVLAFNPVRDARRLPLPEKKTSKLTPGQLAVVRALMRSWRADAGHGPRPNVHVLENGMWIMVGTSVRVGEALALRRRDVDVTAQRPSALVDATMQQSTKLGNRRKPAPKRTRQKRRIALPAFTAEAVRNQLAVTAPGPDAYLFATKAGKPLTVSNYERLLRTFVDDNAEALRAADIDTEQFSTHIFRRSTATIIEEAAGITLASRLLGHANEQITRASYVVTAEQVDPITADILDDAFTDLL